MSARENATTITTPRETQSRSLLHIGETSAQGISGFGFWFVTPIHRSCSVIDFYINSNKVLSENCSRTDDLDTLIDELHASSEGVKLWNKARDTYAEYLRVQLTEGQISKIKYHRLLYDCSQADLASKAGIHQSNIARAEKIGHKSSIATYKRIAAALNIDYQELLP